MKAISWKKCSTDSGDFMIKVYIFPPHAIGNGSLIRAATPRERGANAQ